DPGVMLGPVVQAPLMDFRGEQFRQRRTGGLLPAGTAGKVQISIACKADTGQYVLEGRDLLAAESHRFAQPEPSLDPALARFAAVMVEDALDPDTPNILLRTVRQNGGILEWDIGLVVK